MSGQPNILLLFTDQQRWDALGASGGTLPVHTPNLDRLATQGRRYRFGHTPVPVCIAARHCLLTGHRPVVHRYFTNSSHPNDPATPTIPRLLSRAGYATQATGKMHFMPPRQHNGFGRMMLMEEVPHTREEDDYLIHLARVGQGHIRHQHGVRHLLYHQPQRSIIPEEHQGTHWVADESIRFIRENIRRPWFQWSSFIQPHPPFNAPEKWADFYKTEDMPLPVRSTDEDVNCHMKYLSHLSDLDTASDDKLQRARASYCACVSFVDEQVGRILDALEETGQADNTLVVFTSDHGELLGDHHMWQKSSPFEQAVRVPFIARFPGRIDAGVTSDDFVDLLDLAPTFFDAAGVAYPSDFRPLPGESLLGGCGRRDRSVQHCEIGVGARRWISVRNRRWKLAHWFFNGSQQLFNLENDPDELNNLAREGSELSGEALAARDELLARLIAWENEHGPEPVGEALPNYGAGQETFPLRRNSQFPIWPDNLVDPSESINSVEEEVLAVTRNEPLTKLDELDLDFWVSKGGSEESAKRFRGE